MAWGAVFFSSLQGASQRGKQMADGGGGVGTAGWIAGAGCRLLRAPPHPAGMPPTQRPSLQPSYPPTHLQASLTTSATGAQRRTAPSLTAASGPTHWLTSCAASQACCGTAWNTASWAALVAADRWAAILRAMAEASS